MLTEQLQNELLEYFHSLLAKAKGLERDSLWTRLINTDIAVIGKRHGYSVFASRCDFKVDGPEWLYDHHWRKMDSHGNLLRIPLAMEIEWGFGLKTLRERITEDYLKLVQSRADLKIMVFACANIVEMMNDLERMAKAFEDRGPEDRFLFIGYDLDAHTIVCRAVKV